MRKILGALRKADEAFDLIDPGDKIAVGLSGGKDSMVMLKALSLYKKFAKKPYNITAVCVNLGFDGFDVAGIADFCRREGVHVDIIDTDIAEIVFGIRKEKNPCSLCAKLRKGALYTVAKERGCNKAAFAHHADDAVLTLLMSLLYESRLNTLQPKTYLDRTDITLIRPLLLAKEKDIRHAAKTEGVIPVKNPCPADGNSARSRMKELLKQIEAFKPDARDNILRALLNREKYNLWG